MVVNDSPVVALPVIRPLISVALMAPNSSRRSATAPVTNGAATEVPELLRALVVESHHGATTSAPGAQMSRQVP